MPFENVMAKKHRFPTTVKDVEHDEIDSDERHLLPLPIDRGWAWVILTVSFINMVLSIGYFRSFGILFVEFLKVYKMPASVTSLIMGLQGASMSIGGFVTQTVLMSKFHERTIISAGGFLIGSGVITSTVATSIPTLIVTQSILVGTGISLIIGPIIVILNKYFDKRRGLALAISSTGANVGAIIFPPFVRCMLDEYGFKGTFMITGATMLHIMAFGFLFRPFNHNRRRFARKGSKPLLDDHGQEQNLDTKEEEIHESASRHRAYSDSYEAEEKSKTDTHPGFQDLLVSSSEKLYFTNRNQSHSNKSPEPKNQTSNVRLSIFNFALFKNPLFLIMAATAVFGIHAATTMNSYIPALAEGKGIHNTNAALLLSIVGAIGIVGRLTVGYIADLHVFKRCYMMSLALVLSGVAALCAPLYNGFSTLLIFCFVYGLFGGLYFNLLPIVLIDFLGTEHLSTSFGFIQLFGGASMAAINPLAGWIHDQTGNYDVSYQLFGGLTVLAGAIVLLEIAVVKYKH